jgi:hypothetical protein
MYFSLGELIGPLEEVAYKATECYSITHNPQHLAPATAQVLEKLSPDDVVSRARGIRMANGEIAYIGMYVGLAVSSQRAPSKLVERIGQLVEVLAIPGSPQAMASQPDAVLVRIGICEPDQHVLPYRMPAVVFPQNARESVLVPPQVS